MNEPSQKSKATVIIPSRDGWREGNVPRLVEALFHQAIQLNEVIVVLGVSPPGRARNRGLSAATGDVLVFMDDDISLVGDQVLFNLMRVLDHNPLSLVGASQTPPTSSSPLQKAIAKQYERAVQPVVSKIIESDMVTTACMALRKDFFQQLNGFDEDLIAAEDNDLRARVREYGGTVVLAPFTEIHHPMPKTLQGLWNQNIWYGKARATGPGVKHLLGAIVYFVTGFLKDLYYVTLWRPLWAFARIANRVGRLVEEYNLLTKGASPDEVYASREGTRIILRRGDDVIEALGNSTEVSF